MKIYNFAFAPNPTKLRVYLAEKGIEVPFENVDLTTGQHRAPEFRQKHSLGVLPVLELDDGTCYPESLAIIEYFEELHPEPPMLGTTPEERLRVRGLERICEFGVLVTVAIMVQNTHPFFAQRVKQHPATVEYGRSRMLPVLRTLNQTIGQHPFVAGDAVTIADCTLYAALVFARNMNLDLDLGEYPNLTRWFAAFATRPSAKA